MLNGSIHPRLGEYVLHFADEVKMGEIINFPAPVPFIIEFEHFTDEFRHYENSGFPRKADGSEINPASFVFQFIY